MLKLGERTPPPDELAEAFVRLFRSQQKMDGNYGQLEDVQIETAILTFEYLQRTVFQVENLGLSTDDLRMALRVLDRGSSKAHNRMATLLYEELKARRDHTISQGQEPERLYVDLVPYIKVLCQNDGSLRARDLVDKYWESDLKDEKSFKNGTMEKLPSPWITLLRGIIRERRNEEVAETVEIMQKRDVLFDSKLQSTLVSFYAFYEGDMEMTKKWYQHPVADSRRPSNTLDANVLKLCIRKNELEWGEPIFQRLIERNPQDKASWNMILQWAAAKGRGVDEIEHMMTIMEKRNPRNLNAQPGMDTINALIEFANMREDPYTAERYYALGERRGFRPNARTHLLQLDYRIKVKDLSGAMTAYGRLRGEDLSENEDIPYINKLIVAFCTQADPRYDTIMTLVDDLTERKAPFSPEAVSALSLLHLQRNETMDLIDLLNTHTFHYSLDQRASIHDVLLARALAPETAEAQAWDIYNILRSIFSESMTLPTRVKVMNSFFARRRSDMATIVFSQMRQQKDKALRPTSDTYCEVLVGLSKAGTLEAVETVHNMMKVDSEIEPNTKLSNALMLAYIGVGKSTQAHTFWEDIAHSREGPTYSSIQIAFQACERSASGEKLARDIWRKLKRFDIEVTREIFAAYVGALAGQGKFEEGVDLLGDAERECGQRVDALM